MKNNYIQTETTHCPEHYLIIGQVRSYGYSRIWTHHTNAGSHGETGMGAGGAKVIGL